MAHITFGADSVRFRGPSIDGSWKITFETGEYQREQIAELLKLPTDVALKVTVETDE